MVSIFQALADLEQKNQAGVLCTIVHSQGSTPRHSTSKMLVYPEGNIIGTVGGGEMERRVITEALAALKDRQPRLLAYQMTDPERGDPGVCGGQVEIYVEPVLPKPNLLLIGSGHVGKAVAHLANWLGFQVVVSDDRPEFCNPQAVPDGKLFLPVPMQEVPDHFTITAWTYIVLTTRGANVDVAGMPALLDTPAAYIGVIGSRRRWETTHKALLAAGIDKEKLARVHSPMGLELNAETPEEIAVSIMAEVLMVMHRGDGHRMSAHSRKQEV
jgi:xanthine dehydrogenase accessory factor